MIEDDPDELARIEADADADLEALREQLIGLPRTVPDLRAALAELEDRLARARAEYAACLDRCDDGAPLPDFVRSLGTEITALTRRREDYLTQLGRQN